MDIKSAPNSWTKVKCTCHTLAWLTDTSEICHLICYTGMVDHIRINYLWLGEQSRMTRITRPAKKSLDCYFVLRVIENGRCTVRTLWDTVYDSVIVERCWIPFLNELSIGHFVGGSCSCGERACSAHFVWHSHFYLPLNLQHQYNYSDTHKIVRYTAAVVPWIDWNCC